MRTDHALWVVVLLGTCAACDQDQGTGMTNVNAVPRTGVVEARPWDESVPAAAGQTVYVPAYSSIHSANNTRPFALAVTLSVRNTDRDQPILLGSVRYFDRDGKLVRDYLKRPLRIAPMASVEFFVQEKDKSGGMSASFLVDWVAERAVTDPVVETIMIGTAKTQGISFTCPGRVVKDRTREVPPKARSADRPGRSADVGRRPSEGLGRDG